MSAHTFDGHSVVCPICHRSKRMKMGRSGSGLYTCPYCEQRFVVSQSGHYVRDPVPLKRRPNSQMLRRQSRPLARMRRDFHFGKPIAAIALIGSAIFLAVTLTTPEARQETQNPMQQMWQWVTKSLDR
jgi:ribosomal protein L37AE/L43A